MVTVPEKIIVLASANEGKAREIKNLLAPLGFFVRTSKEVGFTQDIPETGNSFATNALLKARALMDFCHAPVLSDDSGLEVDALDGAPGIYSSRYAGDHAFDADNRKKLLQDLMAKEKNSSVYKARFVCMLCYLEPIALPQYFMGTCDGAIIQVEQGAQGFGYDSIFIPEGESRTFGLMTHEEKAQYSHRAKALRQWVEWLKTRSL